MLRMTLLLALLLAAPPCFAQILIQPNPQATSYLFYAGQPPRAVIEPMTDEEKGHLQRVYTAVLRNNRPLDAEGDALSAQSAAYRKVLMAAMVKADPQVAPMLGGTDGPVTREQSDKILHVQSEVMQADPKLQSQWDDLTKKMTAHQQAIDDAMVKQDPTVKPILAKLSP